MKFATKLTKLLLLLFFCQTIHAQVIEKEILGLTWIKDVGAKKMPNGTTTFCVNDYGAKNDGKTMNTKAIQSAIDECAQKGGGIITFKPGKYLTGSLFLKSGVNLRIDKNVEILGSQDINDYPEIDTRVAGIEMKWPAALINIDKQENVAITGEGSIHGQGKIFWDKYWKMRKEYEPKGLRWIVDYDCKRARLLLISNSSQVTVQGVTLKQSGFWTVQILYSQYVTVEKILILNNIDGHGPSTYGIDIDSSTKILIQNSEIDCNDDNFCLKAGRDADGLRVNRPTEYVVIQNCVARKGGGLITFGSETSGSIRNVLAQNLTANGTSTGIRLKSAKNRGGVLDQLYLYNITMDSVPNPIDIGLNWNPAYSYSELPKGYNPDSVPAHWKVMLTKVDPANGTPKFRNVVMANIKSTNSRIAISAQGMENSLLENFKILDYTVTAKSGGSIGYAKDWTIKNLDLKTQDGSKIKSKNNQNLSITEKQ